VPAAGPAATSQAHVGPAPPVAEDPKKDVNVTPQEKPVVPSGATTEEKVEFRDENGNLLDEEQVKAMEGKVSFSTRYETRTRLVDQAGNEIYEGVVEGDEADHAGTYAEGQNPDTQDPLGENEANTVPPQAAVKDDLRKEKSVEESVVVPEPESDASVKTGKGEL
jgi:dolichyl-phosphate-mannose-protein mannosyltransferase